MLKRKSKRVLSIVLAVAMIVGLFPIAAFAEGGDGTTATIYVAKVDGKEYETLEAAVTAVASATEKTITLINDVTLKSQVTLPEGVTLDGGSHKITAVASESQKWSSANGSKYMILANAANTVIKDVTMDANHNAYGCIQFFKTTDGKVENVTLKNAQNLGLMVNASQVTATGTITLDGNGWGDVINVGWGSNITNVGSCSLDVSKATLVGVDKIYADETDVKNAGIVSGGTESKFSIKVDENDGFISLSDAEGISFVPSTSSEIAATVTKSDQSVAYYSDLQAAIDAAPAGATVTLMKDITLDATGVTNTNGILLITKAITINGNGKTITVKNVTNTPSMINIQNRANVMINSLTIDGGINTDFTKGTKHGLNINQAGTVTLNDVIIKNNSNYAVMNNGSALVVNGLTTSGNQWGINVDSKNGNASIVVNNANIAEASSIVLEKSTNTAEEPVATINGGSLQYVIAQNNADASKLTVNGGQFATGEGTAPTNVVNIKAHVAPGNTLDENGNVVVDSAKAEAEINGFGYETLEEALAEAKNGDVVNVVNDVKVSTQIAPNAGVTINGNGHSVTYTGTTENISGGAFNITNDNVTINDLTINAAGLKHGVQFYCTKGGELNGVTINGGVYTSVIVNGATNVDIIDCVLNPVDGAYTNIEYAMGGKVTTIPSMNINNVTFDSSKPAVWADKDTTDRVETQMVGSQTNEAILAKILDNITYTSPNGGSLAIAVGFSDGNTLVGNEESTYQPPYTGKYSYEIFTKVGDNGAIDVDRYATEGDKVTITVSPDEAYMLDEMTVTSGGKDVEVTDNGDGTYTFTMPSGDVKIEVTFAEDPNWEEEPAMPFVDIDENDWFYDVVLYAYENGLMTGTSADTFAPNQTTTRGMIVSMLARLEGVTNAEDAGFADVAANDWYATAVNWAASVGVVNGYEDNTFRPNAPITREQMAAILYNYADYKGYDVSARADLSDYADAASISSWAEDVLAWANAEGLINGMTATTIDPQGATTRAQTAAMFERFLTAHEA